jgi:hypothetical protein
MRFRTLLFAVLALVAVAARAEAKHVRFLGPHPIAAKYGGGYCYIEAPHLHIYAPDRPALYQQVGDDFVFTGDPTPFGYDGERHPFYGHHPVAVADAAEPVYCVIDGPHFHSYAAPSTPDYRVKNGVAFYVSPIPAPFVRPARVRGVNAEYRPYVSFRPTVEVSPPPEWHGEVYVAGPGVDVRGPAFDVRGPSVEVHAPGIFVPPPPRVAVEVRAPGVFIAPPGPVIVGAPGRVVVGGHHEERWEHREEHWEHHDNGRHEGWGHGGEHDHGEHEHGGHGRGHH